MRPRPKSAWDRTNGERTHRVRARGSRRWQAQGRQALSARPPRGGRWPWRPVSSEPASPTQRPAMTGTTRRSPRRRTTASRPRPFPHGPEAMPSWSYFTPISDAEAPPTTCFRSARRSPDTGVPAVVIMRTGHGSARTATGRAPRDPGEHYSAREIDRIATSVRELKTRFDARRVDPRRTLGRCPHRRSDARAGIRSW